MQSRVIVAYVVAGLVVVAAAVLSLRECANVVAALGPEQIPTAAEFEQLKAEGDEIILQIEEYKQAHGQYPDSLAAAAIVPPPADYGGWQYVRTEQGGFQLSIGQYTVRSPFTLFKRAGDEEWCVDG